MTRKQFFGLLGGAGAATAVVSTASASPSRVETRDVFEHSGWKFRWTGFKTRSDGLFEVGQWLAARIDPIGGEHDFSHRNNAYWCTTGCGDWYNRGDCFNIGLTQSGYEINIDSSNDKREAAKDWALLRLIEFVELEGRIKGPRAQFY
jgi:hypothetical protein